MKVKLQLRKNQSTISECIHDVFDAESFGAACTQLWSEVRERRMEKASSIGALYERLDDRLLDELYGAEISIAKA